MMKIRKKKRTDRRDSQLGATMVESAIVLVVFMNVALFSFSVCEYFYRYFQVATAHRVAGRLVAIESSSTASTPDTLASCIVKFRDRFQESVTAVGFPVVPTVQVQPAEVRVGSMSIRGLQIAVSASHSSYFGWHALLPAEIQRSGFFPLEDQGACLE